MSDGAVVELRLSLDEAETLHALLEGVLEGGAQNPHLEHSYRLLGWRLLSVKGGTGLTGRIAGLARDARNLEEYETSRAAMLGPVLDGLERGENRDP